MPGEAGGALGAEGLSLPLAGARVGWRPPALRTGHALVMRAIAHEAFATGTIGRLQAWHDRMSHRVQPWGGRPSALIAPGAIERPHEDGGAARPASSLGAIRPAHAFPAPIGPHTAAEWGGEDTDAAIPTGDPSIPNADSAMAAPRRTAGGEHPEKFNRPTPDTGGRPVDTSPPPRTASTPAQRVVLPAPAHVPPQIAPGLRPLYLTVSPQPRREVRGGFPAIEPSAGGPAKDQAAPPAVGPARQLEAAPGPQWPPSTVPVPRPDEPTVIERLIERTVRPAPLPGLEIRVVQPQRREQGDERPSLAADARPDTRGAAATAPAAAAAPPLDINAVTDRVYRLLVRRERFERERKGLS